MRKILLGMILILGPLFLFMPKVSAIESYGSNYGCSGASGALGCGYYTTGGELGSGLSANAPLKTNMFRITISYAYQGSPDTFYVVLPYASTTSFEPRHFLSTNIGGGITTAYTYSTTKTMDHSCNSSDSYCGSNYGYIVVKVVPDTEIGVVGNMYFYVNNNFVPSSSFKFLLTRFIMMNESEYANFLSLTSNAVTGAESQKLMKEQLEAINKQIGAIDKQTEAIKEQTDAINYFNNTQHSDMNKQTDEIKKGNDYLMDDTKPDVDISGLGTVSGLLPPGPLDSLLNIPSTFLSVLLSSLSGTCVPLTGTFVYDSTLSLPCFSEMFYSEVPPLLLNFISLIPGAFILIKYFKHLYKKVDRATSLETNSDDEWGAI